MTLCPNCGAELATVPIVQPVGVPPGGIAEGHPFLTPRVQDAVTTGRLTAHRPRPITDADGPHEHHWQAIEVLYECSGCGTHEYWDAQVKHE
jgi:hypothetical protein